MSHMMKVKYKRFSKKKALLCTNSGINTLIVFILFINQIRILIRKKKGFFMYNFNNITN